MDPTYGAMYRAGGKWLNAREIHSLLVSGRRKEISSEPAAGRKELDERISRYHYFRYYLRNDFLSRPVNIEVSDHGDKGKELVFREERLHWDDKYTADMAHKSTKRSSRTEDFDWEYRKPDIKAESALFGSGGFYVETKAGGKYGVKLGGRETVFTGPGRFRFEWAGEDEVSVTDLSRGCGTVFRLGPLW